MGPAMQREYPEIAAVVRSWKWSRALIIHKEKRFYEERFVFADPEVFAVFTFSFIAGDPQTALREPYAVVLTVATARKYFGSLNPLGQRIAFWDNADASVLRSKAFNGNAFDRLFLVPLKEIHQYFTGGLVFIIALFALAVLILLIGCINFMNLATARSAHRAKEVGVRKVIGANRAQLVKQFLGEAMVMAFAALPLALVIALLTVGFQAIKAALATPVEAFRHE
jgi:hypothetical protein